MYSHRTPFLGGNARGITIELEAGWMLYCFSIGRPSCLPVSSAGRMASCAQGIGLRGVFSPRAAYFSIFSITSRMPECQGAILDHSSESHRLIQFGSSLFCMGELESEKLYVSVPSVVNRYALTQSQGNRGYISCLTHIIQRRAFNFSYFQGLYYFFTAIPRCLHRG